MREAFGRGKPGQCGWFTNQLGVSRQIVPRVLRQQRPDQDTEKAQRVMTAMLNMTKLEITRLQEAYAGGAPRKENSYGDH